MILVVLLILSFAPMVAAQPWQVCGISNYTADSIYQSNLKVLSTTLFTKGLDSSGGLFAKGSSGFVPNIVYGVALCRGDVNSSTCRACVKAAFNGATQLCAFSKDATIFYDKCLLRFSDNDILNMDSSSSVNTSAVVDGALILMNISSEPLLPGWDKNSNKARNFTQLYKTMLINTVNQVFYTRNTYATVAWTWMVEMEAPLYRGSTAWRSARQI